MGGGQKLVQSTPPAAPTAGQSAAEYAAALPQILQAQLQYQPAFDQQALDSFRELGPQYAQISRDVLNQYSPNLAALDETLAKQALDMSQNGLSQSAQDMFKNQFKSLVGDQANSGIGANFIAKNLLQQNLAYQSEGRNLGLSLQGKVPISQPYSQPSFNVAQGFAPAFGQNTAAYGSVFSGAGRPQIMQRPDYLGAAGGFLQGVGSIASGGGFGKIF